jgi:chromosome segregation ATPase
MSTTDAAAGPSSRGMSTPGGDSSAVPSSDKAKALSEQLRLNNQIKQLKKEKDQLKSQLEEERAVRESIQCESQKLIGDIKNSCDSKVGRLRVELTHLQEGNESKTRTIEDLQDNLSQLQKKVQKLSSDLQNARNSEGELQGRLSMVS